MSLGNPPGAMALITGAMDMGKRYAMWLGLVLLAVTLVACQSAPKSFEATAAVKISAMQHGNEPALASPEVVLIQSKEALDAIGSEQLSALAVDFSTQSVVILAYGERPTGGFWARITGAQQLGQELYVQGTVNRPGPDLAVTLAVTYPYCAAVLDTTGSLILVSEIEETVGEQPGE
jgi:hypothetical protein